MAITILIDSHFPRLLDGIVRAQDFDVASGGGFGFVLDDKSVKRTVTFSSANEANREHGVFLLL
jgi:hypothetical protein